MSSIKIDLNGPWKFKRANSKEKLLPAKVPGCIHTDLLANKQIPDPFWGSNELELEWIERVDWEYSRSFSVTADVLSRQFVELVADGLDTVASIFINDTFLARTENMFVGYRFDIKPLLKAGSNTIRILFENPMDYIKARKTPETFWEWNDPVGGAALIRKQQCSFGWDWGARFATSGIYKSISIQAYDVNRISSMLVEQTHHDGKVTLTCKPLLAFPESTGLSWRVTVNGQFHEESDNLSVIIDNPKLWWPAGQGEQPLYEIAVELLQNDEVIDTWMHKIGLRTIHLDRHEDQWGESFQFVVNGKPIFAKGANWIPAHCFVSEINREMYDDLLSSATQANMNMLRVWGGGIYEPDIFYELCDEKGLMIWHDFMFACSLYPGDDAFLSLVKQEIDYQTKRIANHSCMALWCGSNEIEQMPAEIQKTEERKKAFLDVFYDIIPATVQKNSPQIAFWPSSPHNPDGWTAGHNNESKGDAHNWEVWHGRRKAEAAWDHQYRFVSEYGMQSYCSIETAKQFCKPSELNVFAPSMENHQKGPTGNSLIFDYISHRYRFPKNVPSLVYLSQINQAYCVQTAVEHHRRCMPRTMGTLYWQINDCWPVFSWASVEFGGRWKALHYAARRFFAPAIVTARLVGGIHVGRINRQVNTVTGVDLYTVYDGKEPLECRMGWTLYQLNGKSIAKGSKKVTLNYGESIKQEALVLDSYFAKYEKATLFLHAFLLDGSSIISQTTAIFTTPRFMELPKEKLTPLIKKVDAKSYRLTFRAKSYQHHVEINIDSAAFRATDNYFDLYPGIPHTIDISLAKPMQQDAFKKKLKVMSLADSY